VTRINLRILGESIIEVGTSIIEPSAPHVFALALYLAIERGKLVPRSVIADLLFPDSSTSAAAHNLRQLLYRLRQKGAPLDCTPATILLPADRVAGAPESALTQSYADAVRNSSSVLLLPGYEPPTPPFSAWIENYRDELAHKIQGRLAKNLYRARQGADWVAVDKFSRAMLAIDPLNESATLGLAEAIARTGSKQKALTLLRAYAHDVGISNHQLTLPSRVLTRRISEDVAQSPVVTSPIVGRDSALRELTDGWHQAKCGRCSTACVTGEKSIGKTRVLDELAAMTRLDDSGVVLMLRPVPSDRDRPMSLFSDLCRQLLQLPGAAGCSPSNLDYLERLTGAPDPSSATRVADVEAGVSEASTRRSILDLLDSVSSERPLLICIDDSENLDSASRSHLATLPQLAPALPVYFVIAGTHSASMGAFSGRLVQLGPLTVTHSHELAETLCTLGGYALTSPSLEWSIGAAAGNPGHLELLLRHVSTLADTPSAPPSLISLLTERLQSLSASARHALQACAVYGTECRPEHISALTGLEGYELLVILEKLVLHGVAIDSETGLSCRSSLIAELVSRSTTPAVRCLLHRRAAEFLERLADTEPMSQALAWRIADHWHAAGSRVRSLHWRQVCWQQLLSIGQPIAAADSIRLQLASSTSAAERAGLLDILAQSLRQASDARGQLSVLAERNSLSAAVGDGIPTRLALTADIAEARYSLFDDTTQLLPDLRALLGASDLDEERRLRIGKVLMVTADNMLSETLAREALTAVPQSPCSTHSLLLSLQIRVIYHAVFGDHATASGLADSLIAVASKLALSQAQVASYLTAALALRLVDTRSCDLALLEPLYHRSLDASMFGAAIRIAGRLGSMLHEDGDLEGAQIWCARTTQLLATSGAQRAPTDYLTLGVDLALADGNVQLARELIGRAPRQFPMIASPKWSNAYLVYRTRVHQFETTRPLAADHLQALLTWHDAAKHLGRHDDHVEVLWTALTRAGRTEEASSLLWSYLTESRRERRPCIFALRTRASADPAWARLSRNCAGVRADRSAAVGTCERASAVIDS
jgi:DNA-binding SARP family transcriptional activator